MEKCKSLEKESIKLLPGNPQEPDERGEVGVKMRQAVFILKSNAFGAGTQLSIESKM